LVCVDEVEAFGPSGVSDHGGVIYIVNIGFDAVLHGHFAFTGYFAAFFNGGGIVDAGVFQFPAVFRVGFTNVDDEKLDLFVVLCI